MQRFAPNTVLYDRFLLTEELSYELQDGQQVWSVRDQQTGQALIARLHADGRVEWFNDNRSAAPAASPMPTQAVIEPKKAAEVFSSDQKPETASKTPSGSKRTFTFLLVLLLTGAAFAAYFYQKPLLAYVESLRSAPAIYIDLASVEAKNIQPERVPDSTEPAAPKASSSAFISVPQALHLLNLLKQIPTEKHPAIFRDAQQAFVDFRRKSGRQSSIDSLYTMCMGRGAQSFLAHQQNGDALSTRYAIEWYQLAYALKPSIGLEGRIDRLRSSRKPSMRKPSAPPKKSRESLFIRDPEVNR